MNLYGKRYSKSQLLAHTGSLYQAFGTRHYILTEGVANGTRAVDVSTGGGLAYTVVPDRGMDISLCTYKGVNLVFQTPNGEVNPAFYNPEGFEWQRTFFAGLLTTCGLTYLGDPGEDEGIMLGQHGRYSAIPARRFCDISRWDGDEYRLEMTGHMEDNVLFGEKISLDRRITSFAGENRLILEDTVTNLAASPCPVTILYHINIGFPLLDEDTLLLLSGGTMECPAENSEYTRVDAPKADAPSEGYLHTMIADHEGYGWAAAVNPTLCEGLGIYIRFTIDTLPFLTQWKMLRTGEYVVGLEPCNVPCKNRGLLRREGQLPFLEPGQEVKMWLEIGILDGMSEITALQNKISMIKIN